MIDIQTIFSPKLCAYCEDGINNKKKALEKISKLISDHNEDVKYHHILNALQQREKIGNTALGHGAAIPHARIAIEKPACALLNLKTAINFSNQEHTPVDLIFGLVVPENYNETHLHILAYLSEKIAQSTFRQQLRQAHRSEQLYQTMVGTHD